MAVNSNPQAVRVANDKIRRLADVVTGVYNEFKSAQIEFTAENWTALFPTTGGQGADTIGDGSDVDGRTIITNQDVTNFMTHVGTLITSIEANSNAMRNNFFKIAPNPIKIST